MKDPGNRSFQYSTIVFNLLVADTNTNLRTNTGIIDFWNEPLQQGDVIFNFNDFNIHNISRHKEIFFTYKTRNRKIIVFSYIWICKQRTGENSEVIFEK